MIHRRRSIVITRLLAVLCLIAGALVAWLPTPATAEAPAAIGWWNKAKPEFPSELGGDPLPPPPDVPDEGFLVANDPTGPMAIAGLRFEATDAVKAVLTLHAPEDSPWADTVELSACPVLTEWEPVFDGAWDNRPELSCDTIEAAGEFNDDRTTVTFQINEEFFRLGVLVSTIEIGLRPSSSSVQPFRAPFAEPGIDALVAVDGGPLIRPAGSGDGEEVLAPPPALPPPAAGSPIGGSDDLGGSLSSDQGLGDTTPTTVANGPQQTETAGQETAAPIASPDSGGERLLAGALLAMLGMGLFLSSTRQPHQPRLIGGLAHRSDGGELDAPPPPGHGEERGLGRFRRARSGQPVG